jgi:hypothetical protein
MADLSNAFISVKFDVVGWVYQSAVGWMWNQPEMVIAPAAARDS